MTTSRHDGHGDVVPWPGEDTDRRTLDQVRELTAPDSGMVDELVANLEARGVAVMDDPGRSSRRQASFALAAAAVIALISIAVVVIQASSPDHKTPLTLARTGAGQTQALSPAPGVDVTLQPNTEISGGLSADDEWTLVLSTGDIGVEVQRDEVQQPVRVVAGDVEVRVTGTRFDVTRMGDDVIVRVIEGSVQVNWSEGMEVLGSGERWARPVTAGPASLADARDGDRVSTATSRLPGSDGAPAGGSTPNPKLLSLATSGDAAGTQPFPDLAIEVGRQVPAGDPATELLARIQTDRALGRPADARLHDLERYMQLHGDTAAAEEVMALHIEALAATGANLETIARSYEYLEVHPEGTRRTGVRWIEATVARDRLHDCSLALQAYRELADIGGPRQAEATYYLGTCSADLGKDEDARQALERCLELGLDGPQAEDARARLEDR